MRVLSLISSPARGRACWRGTPALGARATGWESGWGGCALERPHGREWASWRDSVHAHRRVHRYPSTSLHTSKQHARQCRHGMAVSRSPSKETGAPLRSYRLDWSPASCDLAVGSPSGGRPVRCAWPAGRATGEPVRCVTVGHPPARVCSLCDGACQHTTGATQLPPPQGPVPACLADCDSLVHALRQ
jgi:hypothetical protein